MCVTLLSEAIGKTLNGSGVPVNHVRLHRLGEMVAELLRKDKSGDSGGRMFGSGLNAK